MIPFRRDTVSESSVASMSFDAQRGLFEAKVKYIDSLGMDKKPMPISGDGREML